MDENIDKVLNRKIGLEYAQIDAENQVRLLRISPSASAWPAVCTLEAYDLDLLHETDYTALSYTWGHAYSLQDVREIEVDQRPFFIRHNLWNFLCTAASRDRFGLFFIDAICINQLDYAERQSQVRKMARIFRNATEVVGWLGLPDSEEHENVEALSETGREDYICWTDRQWKGFRYLSFHNYWLRVWIAQEVLLAARLDIWCGSFAFSPTLFEGSAYSQSSPTTCLDGLGRPTVVHGAPSRLRSPAETIITHRLRHVLRWRPDCLELGTRVGTMDELTAALKSPDSRLETYCSPVPDLYHLIIHKFGRRLQCSDPRDRLYGLLGILNERSRARVRPDYTKDVSYAFLQALKLGLQEIYHERSAVPGNVVRQRGNGIGLKFVCNVREAFDVSYDESILALRRVVDELGLRGQLAEDVLELQWQQHLEGVPAQLDPDLKQLLGDAAQEDSGNGRGWLSRYHRRQERLVQRL